MLEKYNNKIHSSIGISPNKASIKPERVEPAKQIEKVSKKKKFDIGDYVRIYRKKRHFEKGYTHKWTNEIFIVNKIFYTNPITYGIRDLKGEEILGRFYREELQKTNSKFINFSN